MLLSDFLQHVREGNLDMVIKGIREGTNPSTTNNWPLLLAYSEASKFARRHSVDIEEAPTYEVMLYLWKYPEVREKILYLCTDLNNEQKNFVTTFPTRITYQRTQMEEILDDEEEEEEEEEDDYYDDDSWLEEGGWSDLEKEYLEAKKVNPFGF